ncbi:MAG: cell division protein ZapB [Candidatus Eisenbacteria bacterium]|nr:cell division protein ZapB [Candidatus Eisenbacteria bacterium]
MQLPGLEELETTVAKAAEEIGGLRSENRRLADLLRAVGKEMDALAGQLSGLEAGRKLDARKRKRIEDRVKSIIEKLR